MLCIQNGTLIDPAGNRMFQGDIFIQGGIIRKIIERDAVKNRGKAEGEYEPDPALEKESDGQSVQLLDASGMLIGPGLVDTHVHFRDPGFTYKEDIFSGSEAAKKGGYTSLILMANTKPPVDNIETLKYVLDKGKQTGIKIETCANVTKGMQGKELTDMQKLSDEGAAGFTDDGIPLLDEALVKKAMTIAANIGKPISFHEENPGKIINNGVNAGRASAFYGIGGSPREAEIDLIERDLKLAAETGAPVVIQHISTKEGVELVRRAKAAGVAVHAEAAPHHFTLTEEAVIEKGTLAKMNPPLRLETDRLAIIEGLKENVIDLIATDHAPHSREEKAQEITKAPSGIIGLETALSLGIRELVMKGYFTFPELFHRMSTAPSSLYNLKGGKLKEGETADLVIFRPEETWTAEKFVSKSANSPFQGETLPGVVYYTICNGKIVYAK